MAKNNNKDNSKSKNKSGNKKGGGGDSSMPRWDSDSQFGNMMHYITGMKVGVDQRNPDRGVMKDAFVFSQAEKGINAGIAKDLMKTSTGQEKELATHAADLDRRNTLDSMTAEHRFNLEGMSASTRHQQDLMKSEYGFNIGTMQKGSDLKRAEMGDEYNYDIGKIKQTGAEERSTIETQGEVTRKNTAFEREHAAKLATAYSRRA
jgi:hypothetical protein